MPLQPSPRHQQGGLQGRGKVRRRDITVWCSIQTTIGELIVQTVESANTIYNKNAAAIESASDAMENLTRSGILKKTPSDLLVVAKKVMNALDIVKEVHPFVGGMCRQCQCSPSTNK